MLARNTFYGFISCYLATWLVYCPPNRRDLLYVSVVFLSTTTASARAPAPGCDARSTAATACGALAFLQWLALRNAPRHPHQLQQPTGLQGPAADGGSGGSSTSGSDITDELDAGGQSGSGHLYSPSS